MNCRQKLGSEVKKGDLRTSYLFTHAKWAICDPQWLLYVDDRDILYLPSKSRGSLQLCVIGVIGVDEWRWEHYWSWGNLPAGIPDLGEIQLLYHNLHSCAKSLQVDFVDIMLHHSGWALRGDQQRNIWADMELQNIWKLRTDKVKEIKFFVIWSAA